MKELKKQQLLLAKKIITTPELPEEIKFVGGTDQVTMDNKVIAVITVLSYPKLEEIEKKYAVKEQDVKHNPGYKYYQEGPAIEEAYNKLNQKPDILLVKGNGVLHPRRMGIATHIGISLGIPTIGIAKNILCGELRQDTLYLEDEPRGRLLVTKKLGNPIFISPGHKIDLEKAYEITKKCVIPPHKMPEPIAIAHKTIIKLKKFQKEKTD